MLAGMSTQRTVTVTAPDGKQFTAEAVVPESGSGSGSGSGVLLLQEIFGVNDFLLGKARDLADLGYVVLCPDVFWRVQPGVSLPHDEAALQEAFGYVQRYSEDVDDETRVGDLVAALQALRGLPEVTGKAAVMGYCLGGALSYAVAAAGEPDACVSYYGSGIADRLALAGAITCPVLFHFGGSDPYIPREQVDAIQSAFADRSDVTFVVQEEAGHAFENLLAPAFANPQAAARSWPVTVDFLAGTLGRSGG